MKPQRIVRLWLWIPEVGDPIHLGTFLLCCLLPSKTPQRSGVTGSNVRNWKVSCCKISISCCTITLSTREKIPWEGLKIKSRKRADEEQLQFNLDRAPINPKNPLTTGGSCSSIRNFRVSKADYMKITNLPEQLLIKVYSLLGDCSNYQ